MEKFVRRRGPEGIDEVEVSLRGRALLSHPMYNKGTAFTEEERLELGVQGLLPEHTASTDIQEDRTYRAIVRKPDPIERYIGLAALQDRNEVLFYRLLNRHLEEFLPIVYTPTVGQACRKYSHIFRRGRGIWITPRDRGRIHRVLGNAPYQDVKLIVVTDNERILGLGDLGAGGIGIPIGKLALYTVGAGIHPTQTLPISLDVGTDNEELLNDPLYVGWPHRRLRGEQYHSLVEEFVEAVKQRFPDALVQWEDFKKNNAFDILDRYAERLPSFNDDIQGTAGVTLAGVYAACRVTDTPMERHRFVILGAGAAGIGIGRQLREALRRAGMTGSELTRAIAVLDSRGLLVQGRNESDPYKHEFAWPENEVRAAGLDPAAELDLHSVVSAVRPTVLIGTSGQPGIFDEALVREMAHHVDRPVIAPISNPTANAEAVPEDLIHWTGGRVVMATGSPFEPVEYRGRTYRVAQGNNVYIFPGVGLGALAAGAREVTDRLFTVAAETLAELVPESHLDEGLLFPPLSDLRSISRSIGIEVARAAVEDGLAPSRPAAELTRAVDALMWRPHYPRYIPV